MPLMGPRLFLRYLIELNLIVLNFLLYRLLLRRRCYSNSNNSNNSNISRLSSHSRTSSIIQLSLTAPPRGLRGSPRKISLATTSDHYQELQPQVATEMLMSSSASSMSR